MTKERILLDLEACVLTAVDDDILHVHFKDGRTVEVPDVQRMFDAVAQKRNGRKALLLVSVGEGTAMSNAARVHASSEASNAIIAADAIIVRDFAHQLAANVFVRHHKPGRPIRMFPDRDGALAWLSQQRHLIDQA